LPGYEDYTINVLLAPDQGIELIASPSPDDFAAYVKSEVARYAKLAKDAGIKAD
jgi:tripartite-type tricarboxylate transporter receptor subunit TctC